MTDKVCDGSCSQRFWLQHSPEKIWELYEDSIKAGREQTQDIFTIGPMVIPIEPGTPKGWWYTCRHWDTSTRLCKIYEKRPVMCRSFPYLDPCPHCGWINEEYIEEKNNSALAPGPIGLKE